MKNPLSFKQNRSNRALCHAHSQWNGLAFSASSASMIERVRNYFKSHQVVHIDNEIMLTDVGFVMMAIHTDRAVEIENTLVVPGIDSEGQCGHLVLCDSKIPFHSFHSDSTDAYLEARLAQQKAQDLVAEFGSKSALQDAVSKTAWYSMSTMQDLERTGLCEWGARSFLHRYRLSTLAEHVGLPKFLLQLAGSYGDRIIAARLTRVQSSMTSLKRARIS